MPKQADRLFFWIIMAVIFLAIASLSYFTFSSKTLTPSITTLHTKKETLYVGNSNEDALFAHNVGVDFLYLERRKHEFDMTKYSIAEIHSLDELF